MNVYRLQNGLRVVIETIPTSRSVSFGIWVKIGSRNEQKQNNGISHLIEHMLFKGTNRYSAKDIANYFDGIGGMVNAFTAKEYTCYYAKVLDEHLPRTVEVLSDMFFHSLFEESELEKEKNVVLEEIAMYEDTPDDYVHDLIAKACYGDHPLGYPILGTKENLISFTPEQLKQYVQSNYTIPNTVLSMAGNVDESILPLLEQCFSEARTVDHQQETTVEPSFAANQLWYEKSTEQNHICLSFPGCSLKDPNLYAMILLNNYIGGGMSSRLFQEIRENRGLAYSVYSYHTSHLDSGLFTIYIGTAPKQTEEVLKVTHDVLNDIVARGLTEEELSRGKEQMKGSLILGLEGNGSRMNRMGKNELLLGTHYTIDEMMNTIENINLDQIQSMIQTGIAKPFASAMVGHSAKSLDQMRREYHEASRSN